MELMPLIAAERRRMADLVDTLTPEQLAAPSLCTQWTVREVIGHVLAPLVTRPLSTLPLLARSGFRLHRFNAELGRLVGDRPPGELAAALRAQAENPFAPPVVGHFGQLTDLQVHRQDIRRPLGLPADLLPEPLRVSLGFVMSRRAVGFTDRRRVAGLRFEAADLDWAHGTGPTVRGTGEALLMALTGRPVALTDLGGDGAAVLRGRVAR
ncbi:maleylpyruvate isomerase family mycothiol-dependent enzyme [Micromonospora sp. NPDC000089]|uniref:maleylpyruvate isomerase family mycothiol-dependent enzyme n=1 Tax=unclassified Micromonospora TaxID=2617518 RepID=UPI00369F54C2